MLCHFLPEAIIEAAGLETHKAALGRRAGHAYSLSAIKLAVGATVHRQVQHFLALTDVFDLQHRVVGEDQGTCRQRVGAAIGPPADME